MEYLALQESLKIYDVFKKSTKKKFKVNYYVSRCKTRPKKVLNLLSKIDPLANSLNKHFRKKKVILPAGQIYLTQKALPKKYYTKIKEKTMRRRSPAQWNKKSNPQNCSII